MPSSESSKSDGGRLSNSGKGVASQWDALCSSPNTATACATTGTMRLTESCEAIWFLSDCNACLPQHFKQVAVVIRPRAHPAHRRRCRDTAGPVRHHEHPGRGEHILLRIGVAPDYQRLFSGVLREALHHRL